MSEENSTTEEKILQSAEIEFLEKGFDRAKISTIAKNANVNHAMIHYYFRTKENIFNIVFKNKIELLAKQLGRSFDEENDFFQQLDSAIDSHFSFVQDNPNIVFFVLREVTTDSEQIQMLRNLIKPKIENVLVQLDKGIQREIEKETIRPISAIDLLMNIISLNVSSILALNVLSKAGEGFMSSISDQFLQHRRDHIKELIVNSIRL